MEITIFELDKSGNIKKIAELPKGILLSCAFGCFDGVHIGHQALIRAACESAEQLNRELALKHLDKEDAVNRRKISEFEHKVFPAVWTFSEPVSKPWIFPISKRLSMCGRYGIRYAICQRFEDVRELTPKEFICELNGISDICHGICGFNFSFGKDKSGDSEVLGKEISECINKKEELRELLRNTNTIASPVTVINEVRAAGDTVSSTRIRRLISLGDIITAAELLGRPYSVEGKILSGNKLGRTYNRPTANLRYSVGQLIPKCGVYFTECRIGNEIYRSITNVGSRPTVNNDESDVTCEVHIFDFDRVVYGETAEITFLHFSRSERRFGSVAELSEQIEKDVKEAERFFMSRSR